MSQTNQKTGIIYALICPISGEVKYIGQTTRTLNKRFSGHLCEALRVKETKERDLTYKENWLLKLKTLEKLNNIKKEVLETCPVEILDEREIYWIKFYTEKGIKLTNLTTGGDARRGWKHSQKTKDKISKGLLNSVKFQTMAHKPKSEEIKQKLRQPRSEKVKENCRRAQLLYFSTHEGTFKNKKHSKETKHKLSVMRKEYFKTHPGTFTNKKHSEVTIRKIKEKLQRKVELYNLDKSLIQTFPSIRDLGDYFGLKNITGLRTSALKQKEYKKKYILKYADTGWLIGNNL